MRIDPSPPDDFDELDESDDPLDDDPDESESESESLDTISDNRSNVSRPSFSRPVFFRLLSPVFWSNPSSARFLDGVAMGRSFGVNVGGGAPPKRALISGPRIGLRMTWDGSRCIVGIVGIVGAVAGGVDDAA